MAASLHFPHLWSKPSSLHRPSRLATSPRPVSSRGLVAIADGDAGEPVSGEARDVQQNGVEATVRCVAGEARDGRPCVGLECESIGLPPLRKSKPNSLSPRKVLSARCWPITAHHAGPSSRTGTCTKFLNFKTGSRRRPLLSVAGDPTGNMDGLSSHQSTSLIAESLSPDIRSLTQRSPSDLMKLLLSGGNGPFHGLFVLGCRCSTLGCKTDALLTTGEPLLTIEIAPTSLIHSPLHC